MGIKPLYFFSNGDFIYFGSEIRPLKFIYDLILINEILVKLCFLDMQAVNQLDIKVSSKYYLDLIIT